MNNQAQQEHLKASSAHMEGDIAEIKTDLRGFRQEIKAELSGFRQEFSAELREIRRDMRTDFRLLFSALIIAVLGLAGLLARGFGWL